MGFPTGEWEIRRGQNPAAKSVFPSFRGGGCIESPGKARLNRPSPRSARGPLGPPSWGGRRWVVCAWVTSGGQSAWVVHSASDQVWCGGRLPVVAHTSTVEDSGVTLGYRDADSLQELRLLLACVPARTPSLLLLLPVGVVACLLSERTRFHMELFDDMPAPAGR